MDRPLMPKATAVWLVENTGLTFDQIADFCGLHPLEVKGIADGEVATGVRGLDPVGAGMLTRAEIQRAEADPKARHEAAAKLDRPRRQAAQAQGAALHAAVQAPGSAGRHRLAAAPPSRAERPAGSASCWAPPRRRCRRCATGPTGRARRSARAIRCCSACAGRSSSTMPVLRAKHRAGPARPPGPAPQPPTAADAGLRGRFRRLSRLLVRGLSRRAGASSAPTAGAGRARSGGDPAQIAGARCAAACPG